MKFVAPEMLRIFLSQNVLLSRSLVGPWLLSGLHWSFCRGQRLLSFPLAFPYLRRNSFGPNAGYKRLVRWLLVWHQNHRKTP